MTTFLIAFLASALGGLIAGLWVVERQKRLNRAHERSLEVWSQAIKNTVAHLDSAENLVLAAQGLAETKKSVDDLVATSRMVDKIEAATEKLDAYRHGDWRAR